MGSAGSNRVMELRNGLLIGFALIAIGVALLSIPFEDADMHVVDREDVWLTEWGATMTSLDVPSIGHYQVWVEDTLPGEEDYPYMVFVVDDGDVPVERGDGSVVRNIDGVPHELFCTFDLEGRDTHFYDTWTEGQFQGDVHLELVFTRQTVWSDRPLLWPAFALVVLGLIVIIFFLLRDFRAAR